MPAAAGTSACSATATSRSASARSTPHARRSAGSPAAQVRSCMIVAPLVNQQLLGSGRRVVLDGGHGRGGPGAAQLAQDLQEVTVDGQHECELIWLAGTSR